MLDCGRMPEPSRRDLLGVALISATLLMTELALTRIFSVVMYYHFAFLAISIALFGLSASGVFAYVFRARVGRFATAPLLAGLSVLYAAATAVALFFIVRIHAGLTYSPKNLLKLLLIYSFATLPFLSGGLVLTLAVSRFAKRINTVYACDLCGAALGCLLLVPLLDRIGAPGVVLASAVAALAGAVLFAPAGTRPKVAVMTAAASAIVLAGHIWGAISFDIAVTKGHLGDVVLFSKWNSFSRVGVYERDHADWSLSPAYSGVRPDTRYMDIDSAASTPILHLTPDLSDAGYLKYELTAIAYHLKTPGFNALVIGPGGGRDIVSALVFGASRVDGVEINPIIADDIMRDRFRDFSGGVYTNPKVRIAVDDGRSYVRRSHDRFGVIQASLIDTWAATGAGAYTLTENSLYTVEAFDDYVDHLDDDGVLTITRWVSDGLRLVSLAQAACEKRGWDPRTRIAVVQQNDVATVMLKRSPLTDEDVARLRRDADALDFRVLYAPAAPGQPVSSGRRQAKPVAALTDAYADLVLAPDRERFYDAYEMNVRPTTDDRPFYFHMTKLRNQAAVVFGQSMLFGNGLSALLTLMGLSTLMVVVFVVGPLALTRTETAQGWPTWLVYFGSLGAGFMLIEVSVLQRFVLLLGHPVYSLTVTLFSLLLGTGAGAALSRRFDEAALRRTATIVLMLIAVSVLGVMLLSAPLISWGIPFPRPARILMAVAALVPIGILLGIPMPAGIRLLNARAPEMLTWAWGINGALSVLGSTVAIFIAMNWGFRITLLAAATTYALALGALRVATSER